MTIEKLGASLDSAWYKHMQSNLSRREVLKESARSSGHVEVGMVEVRC
jgi:hypothetical protein